MMAEVYISPVCRRGPLVLLFTLFTLRVIKCSKKFLLECMFELEFLAAAAGTEMVRPVTLTGALD